MFNLKVVGLVGMFLTALTFSSVVDTYSTISAVVTNVNGDEITAVDKVGYEWIFFGDEVSVGKNITLVFDNNHTLNRLDDIVVDFKM